MIVELSGDGFYPSQLKEKTNLPIFSLIECGEIAKIGRYKGTPSPYGVGTIKAPDNNLLEWTNKLLEYIDDIKESGVDEIIFDMEMAETDFSEEINTNIEKLNAKIYFYER